MTQEVELGLRRSTKVDLQKTVQGEVWNPEVQRKPQVTHK